MKPVKYNEFFEKLRLSIQKLEFTNKEDRYLRQIRNIKIKDGLVIANIVTHSEYIEERVEKEKIYTLQQLGVCI